MTIEYYLNREHRFRGTLIEFSEQFQNIQNDD